MLFLKKSGGELAEAGEVVEVKLHLEHLEPLIPADPNVVVGIPDDPDDAEV